MSKIPWIIFVIAFGVTMFLIVIRIKTNIANEYVTYGIPSGLLIAVMYTSLWRICKTTSFAKNNRSIYLKNSWRCSLSQLVFWYFAVVLCELTIAAS